MKTQTGKHRFLYLAAALLLTATLLAGYSCAPDSPTSTQNPPQSTPEKPVKKVDDWNTLPDPQEINGGGMPVPAPAPSLGRAPVPTATPAPMIVQTPPPVIEIPPAPAPVAIGAAQSQAGNIGLSTGGAKDINNFRENILNDFLPLPTDVTYEGLFYDYYFDTGQTEECDSLFCPSYSYAFSRDPFSGEVEHYLSVGLNSGMKESDFQRKKLNLVIVLDISGSMNHPFDSYYYDQFGRQVEVEKEDAGKYKVEIAAESVVALLDHLNDDDRFGMVLFNNGAFMAKPMNPVGETDMAAIKDHILEISAHGGTNLDAGMLMASGMFDEVEDADPSEYENRIIFLTDAMPNRGDTSKDGMLGMLEDNAGRRVYTTFIGIGVDFNSELVEFITKIKGANYYSVHYAKEFRERMDDEFEYMVTPLVFDLELTLEADGWEIEKVYGSPEADEATGELMKVNTLFPSKRVDEETRGGLVLLKLHNNGEGGRLTLTASYEDRNGKKETVKKTVDIPDENPEFFANDGIRKGVLLSRYADLLKNWMIDEREHADFSRPWEPVIDDEVGIIVPPPVQLGQWERQSMTLTVSERYADLFREFKTYFGKEMKAIGDDTLEQETEVLDELASH